MSHRYSDRLTAEHRIIFTDQSDNGTPRCRLCRHWDAFVGLNERETDWQKHRGNCERFPTHIETIAAHYCGEFNLKGPA